MKVLFIGDIVGSPGRKAVREILDSVGREMPFDFCVANGENSAGGTGITAAVAQELYKCGIDALTMGNHTWAKKELFGYIDSDPKIVRPANYPDELPAGVP